MTELGQVVKLVVATTVFVILYSGARRVNADARDRHENFGFFCRLGDRLRKRGGRVDSTRPDVLLEARRPPLRRVEYVLTG